MGTQMEKKISPMISEESIMLARQARNETDWDNNSKMPEVWDNTEDYSFTKR